MRLPVFLGIPPLPNPSSHSFHLRTALHSSHAPGPTGPLLPQVVLVEKVGGLIADQTNSADVHADPPPRFLAAAVVVPNRHVPDDVPLTNFVRPIEFVESAVGVTFFPEIRKAIADGATLAKRAGLPRKSKQKALPLPSESQSVAAVVPLCDHSVCSLPRSVFRQPGKTSKSDESHDT